MPVEDRFMKRSRGKNISCRKSPRTIRGGEPKQRGVGPKSGSAHDAPKILESGGRVVNGKVTGNDHEGQGPSGLIFLVQMLRES